MRWRFLLPSFFGVRIFFYAGVSPISTVTYIYLVLCPFRIVYGVRAVEKE